MVLVMCRVDTQGEMNAGPDEVAVGLSGVQRESLLAIEGAVVNVTAVSKTEDSSETSLFSTASVDGYDEVVAVIELEYGSKKVTVKSLENDDIEASIQKHLIPGWSVICAGQVFPIRCEGILFNARCKRISTSRIVDGVPETKSKSAVVYSPSLSFHASGKDFQVVRDGGTAHHRSRILTSFNIQDMGVGGLDDQFESVFRRAFLPRLMTGEQRKIFGMKRCPVGVLLYGPPGTGKTLIARKIGEILGCREPKIVNGPEIMNKYVGESEKAVRGLFADAKKDFDENGDDADLHLIIFDELDAIGTSRTGGGGAGAETGSKVVTQLLTMMDGYEAIGNVIVVGMTNRIDVLDAALLRSGRFQVQQEIGLPDERGRRQILEIHTRDMVEIGSLADDVNIDTLAKKSLFYTGAELEEVVQLAGTRAMSRCMTEEGQFDASKSHEGVVTHGDFIASLREKKPQFVGDSYECRATLDDIVLFNDSLKTFGEKLPQFFAKVSMSSRTGATVFAIAGEAQSGKSTLADVIATASMFSYVRRVNDRAHMSRVLDEVSAKPSGVIIVDDLEFFCANDGGFGDWMRLTLSRRTKTRLLVLVTVQSLDFWHSLKIGSKIEVALEPVKGVDQFKSVLMGIRKSPKVAGDADGDDEVASGGAEAATDDDSHDVDVQQPPLFADGAVLDKLAAFCNGHGLGEAGVGVIVDAAREAEVLLKEASSKGEADLATLFKAAYVQSFSGGSLWYD